MFKTLCKTSFHKYLLAKYQGTDYNKSFKKAKKWFLRVKHSKETALLSFWAQKLIFFSKGLVSIFTVKNGMLIKSVFLFLKIYLHVIQFLNLIKSHQLNLENWRQMIKKSCFFFILKITAFNRFVQDNVSQALKYGLCH